MGLDWSGLAVAAGALVTVSSTTVAADASVSIEETIDAGPYSLTSASCERNEGGTPTNGPGTLDNGTLTFTPAPGEDIICTFVNTVKKSMIAWKRKPSGSSTGASTTC